MLCQKCGNAEATTLWVSVDCGPKSGELVCDPCAEAILRVEPVPLATPQKRKAPRRPSSNEPPPKEIFLPRKITVLALSEGIRAKPFSVVSHLMKLGLFCSPQTEIDYASAAQVCVRFGVLPRPA